MKKKIFKVLVMLAAFFMIFQILLNVSAGSLGMNSIKALDASTDEESNDVNEEAYIMENEDGFVTDLDADSDIDSDADSDAYIMENEDEFATSSDADQFKILEVVTDKESYDINEYVTFTVTATKQLLSVTFESLDGSIQFRGDSYRNELVNNTYVYSFSKIFRSGFSEKLIVTAYDFAQHAAEQTEIYLEVKEPETKEIFSVNLTQKTSPSVQILVKTSENVENVFWHLKDQQITSDPMRLVSEKDGEKTFYADEYFPVFKDSLYIIATDKDGREIDEYHHGILDTSQIYRIEEPGYSYIGTYTAVDVLTKSSVSQVSVYDSEDNEVCTTKSAVKSFRYRLHIPVTEAGSKTYKIVAGHLGNKYSDVKYVTINAVEPDWNAVDFQGEVGPIPFYFNYGFPRGSDADGYYGRLGEPLTVTYSMIGKLDNIVVLDSFGNEIISITDVPMPVDFTNSFNFYKNFQTDGTVEIDLLSFIGEQKYTIIFTDVNGNVLESVIDVMVYGSGKKPLIDGKSK